MWTIVHRTVITLKQDLWKTGLHLPLVKNRFAFTISYYFGIMNLLSNVNTNLLKSCSIYFLSASGDLHTLMKLMKFLVV